jgi:Uma2 family endonuclease
MAATALLETLDPAVPSEVKEWDDDALYEEVDGQRVETPPMSVYAVKIATRLARMLGNFADDQQLGEVVGEMLFRLPLKEELQRKRRPDIAFVSNQRWPADGSRTTRDDAWEVAPDLAVEVVSPNDLIEEVLDKIFEYFQAGVLLVWVVFPNHRLIHVYEATGKVRAIAEPDHLDGGTVLPGFQLPLDRLFDRVAPASDAARSRSSV